MSYFVSSPDEASWEYDIDAFRTRLNDWPGVTVRDTQAQDPHYLNVIEFVVQGRTGDIFGALDSTQQIVLLDGFLGDCALFALWLRTWVPPRVELLFYDEEYSADVALVAFTNESDVVRAFGA